MLNALAAGVIGLRWWIIAGWAGVFLLSLTLAPSVTSELKSGFGEVDTESRVALRQMRESLGLAESSITLVFSSDYLEAHNPAYVSEVEAAIAPLRDISEIVRIVTFYGVWDRGQPQGVRTGMIPDSGLTADDGRTTYAWVELDTAIDDSADLVGPIRERLGDAELGVWVTGGIGIFADLSSATEADFRRAEIVTLPLLALALLIVFGGAVAAGLPVAMGLVSVVTTLALVFVMSRVTDMSVFALSIVSFLGLGMAVDYSLLMVSRFREELGAAGSAAAAVSATMETAGKSIMFSAGTSVIALSGLLFFDFMMLRSLGIGGIAVIALSMSIALTLIPALLAALGHRVDSLTLWRRGRASGGRGEGGFWFALSRWVMRHPIAVIVPVTVFLIALGLPFLDVKLGSPWASVLPESAESRQGWELAAERFGPGELAKIFVVETSETSTLSAENIAANLDFVERMEADDRVARVESVFGAEAGMSRERAAALLTLDDPAAVEGETARAALGSLVSEDRRTQVVRVVPKHPPTSEETKSLVADIRASPPRGDMEVGLTGVSPDLMDTVDRMYSDFPKVILYVSAVTYAALFLLFRSALLPLKAVALNVLSILASFGALVFVFQWGNFQTLLGFTSEGFTEATVPILLFSVVFGLSMDYEIFLLSRVKEEYERTGDNARAVAVGMDRSGRVITSSAAVLALVCAGFATGDILIIKALGLGTALAVLIDSTVVRALLAPALMRVMSDLNWWAPGFLGGGGSSHRPPRSDWL